MAEHSWPRVVDLLFDLVACELFWVVDQQTDDLCFVVAFVPKFEREVVVAPNLFRNRTELGEADAETGQPACAVAHPHPVRLPPHVAVLLEQVEDLGLCHGASLLSTDPRQRATWQGSSVIEASRCPACWLTQVIGAPVCNSSVEYGDPNVRELEPDSRMARASTGAPTRSLSAPSSVPVASLLNAATSWVTDRVTRSSFP